MIQLKNTERSYKADAGQTWVPRPTGNPHSRQAKKILELFRKLNQQGTTIVQVTHSDLNATYGTRTVQLADGWITADSAHPDLRETTDGRS